MKELASTLDTAQSIVPSVRTSSVNGTGVDLANYSGNMFFVGFGVVTDGTFTPKLQDSPDNSTFTDVAAADQVGTFTAVTSSSGGSAQQEVGYIGGQRYVRVVITVATATTGALVDAYAVLSGKRKQP